MTSIFSRPFKEYSEFKTIQKQFIKEEEASLLENYHATHDDEDKHRKSNGYRFGIELNTKMTQEEWNILEQQISEMLVGKFHVRGDAFNKFPLTGAISFTLHIPIVNIPSLPEIWHLSEKHQRILQKRVDWLAGYTTVLLQLVLETKELRGGIAFQKTPEGAVVDNANFKIEMAFTPGFEGEREKASALVESICSLPFIQETCSKRPVRLLE